MSGRSGCNCSRALMPIKSSDAWGQHADWHQRICSTNIYWVPTHARHWRISSFHKMWHKRSCTWSFHQTAPCSLCVTGWPSPPWSAFSYHACQWEQIPSLEHLLHIQGFVTAQHPAWINSLSLPKWSYEIVSTLPISHKLKTGFGRVEPTPPQPHY